MRKTLFVLFVGMLSLMLLTTSCGGGTIPSPTTITSPSKPIPEMGKQRLEDRAQGLMNALFDGRVTDLNSFASESERLSLDQQTKAIEELATTGTLREAGYQFDLTESSLSRANRLAKSGSQSILLLFRNPAINHYPSAFSLPGRMGTISSRSWKRESRIRQGWL